MRLLVYMYVLIFLSNPPPSITVRRDVADFAIPNESSTYNTNKNYES